VSNRLRNNIEATSRDILLILCLGHCDLAEVNWRAGVELEEQGIGSCLGEIGDEVEEDEEGILG